MLVFVVWKTVSYDKAFNFLPMRFSFLSIAESFMWEVQQWYNLLLFPYSSFFTWLILWPLIVWVVLLNHVLILEGTQLAEDLFNLLLINSNPPWLSLFSTSTIFCLKSVEYFTQKDAIILRIFWSSSNVNHLE